MQSSSSSSSVNKLCVYIYINKKMIGKIPTNKKLSIYISQQAREARRLKAKEWIRHRRSRLFTMHRRRH
jgi:hypothetical protein